MLVILFAFVSVASLLGVPVSSDDSSEQASLYDYRNDLCCEGTVYEDLPDVRCCGSKIARHYEELCCNDTVIARPADDKNLDYRCAYDRETGQELPMIYNASSQYMCDGKMVDRDDSGNDDCCNGVPFDFSKQTCCDGKLHDGDFALCCGDTPYDSSNQTCCEDKLHDGDFSSCCGDTPYNYDTHECCQEGEQAVRYDKVEGLTCCGLNRYNTSCETCCWKYPDGDYSYLKMEHKIHQTSRPYAPCCGLEVYDRKTESCVDDKKVVPRPESDEYGASCGEHDFIKDYDKEMCCAGVKHTFEKMHSAMACCGNQTYNEMTHVCCANEIVPKEGGKQCCEQAGVLYDSVDQVCCNAGVVTLTEDDKSNGRQQCCEVYTPRVYHGRK